MFQNVCNFSDQLRSGGPSLSSSAHYPQGFANFICDCYLQDWAAWIWNYGVVFLRLKTRFSYNFILLNCMCMRLMGTYLNLICLWQHLAYQRWALWCLGMKHICSNLPSMVRCFGSLSNPLAISQVPPFDWKDAQLEEVRHFLLKEQAAGRFVPTSGLTL